MTSFIPFIIPFLLGFFILVHLMGRPRSANINLFALISAAPVGLATCSLILFWSYQAGNALGKNAAIALSLTILIISIIALVKIESGSPRKSLPLKTARERKPLLEKVTTVPNLIKAALILFSLALLIYWLYRFWNFFASKMVWDVFGGWDARFFWNLKAKFYYRNPADWQQMFSPVIFWSHPGYPLMLPGAVAWGWNWASQEMLVWPNLVNLSFFLSLVLLTSWYISSVTSLWCGLLAGTFLLTMRALTFWSATQYADIPLCFFITSSAVTAVLALRSNKALLFTLSGFLAGLAIWTKDEGFLFALCLTASMLAALFTAKQLTILAKIKILSLFFAGIAFPAFSNIFIKMFLGTTGGEYIGSGRSSAELLKQLTNVQNIKLIAAAFWTFIQNIERWRAIWFLVIAAVLLNPKRTFENYRWIFLCLILSINLGYFVILNMTPHDLWQQITTALERLLLHSSGLAVILTFEVLSTHLLSVRKQQA